MRLTVIWTDKWDTRPRKGIVTCNPAGSTCGRLPVLVPDDEGFLLAKSSDLKGVELVCSSRQADIHQEILRLAEEAGYRFRLEG
jgi:hypothetical protein